MSWCVHFRNTGQLLVTPSSASRMRSAFSRFASSASRRSSSRSRSLEAAVEPDVLTLCSAAPRDEELPKSDERAGAARGDGEASQGEQEEKGERERERERERARAKSKEE